MKDQTRTNQKPIDENAFLKQRIQELEKSEAEHKLTDGELLLANQKLKLHFEQTPMVVIEWDLDFRVTRWNPAAQTIFGFSPEEAIGQQASFIVPEAFRPHVDQVWQALLKTGGGKRSTNRNVRKDGMTILCEWYNTPLVDERGTVTGVASLVQDITERNQAEEALHVSEENYRRSLDESPQGIRIVSKEGETLYANRATLDIFGYDSIKEWQTTQAVKRYTEQSYAEFKVRREKRRLGENDSSEYGIDIVRKDGEVRHLQIWRKRVLWNGKEQYQVIYRDITERKQAEEDLRESEQRLRHLTDNLPNAVVYQLTAEPDGGRRFTYISRAVERLNETTEEEVLADAGVLYGQVLPEYCAVVREREEEALKNLTTMQVEVQSRLPSGRLCWFEYTSVPRHQADGFLVWDGVEVDITERKRMEEELLKAQKLESVGILAGGIAHDFNNILTSISGNISMAKMQVKPGHKIFDLLSAAETASMKAQGLTSQLLTFAKGGAPIKETASIQKLIKDSSLFMLQGSKSGCEFQMTEDLWPVEADAGQISQAISNIAINANQAMPEGGIIRITAENLVLEESQGLPLKPGRYIRISIKDQGVGIAEKHLSKIFDPYFTTKQAGSGLGLATAYSIIKKHNGHISVDSLPEAGTTFNIYLPASDKEVPVKEEAILLTGRGRILVMDDDKLLREMACDMLEMLGYESEFARDGAETIEMYRKATESEKPYDAVILDLTIPGGMGGEEAIKILLNMDPEVKAIVYSGYSDSEVMSNFRKYGFKGMMPKPFDLQTLGKVLNDVLK